MKWTIEEAEAFGLGHGERYAYRYKSNPWILKGFKVVIDLKSGHIVADNNDEEKAVEALDLPKFDDLKTCLAYLRLHE